ncbi:MAG: hypothetical protein R3293_23380 [Candidatus Promineifilaceae bacterium]|nr:hypothetical protein [Candidatus Promineifilaceae bacterium]
MDVEMVNQMQQLMAQQGIVPAGEGVNGQFGASDPMMTLMNSLLAQKRQQRDEQETELDRYRRQLAKARRMLKELRLYMESAEDTLRYFADLFGACAACWGQHAECPNCHGQGQPGFRLPQEEDLLAWTQPSLNRIGLKVVAVGPHDS